MKKFLCKLCGYVHECESLEINYVCPVCGVNASQFEEFEKEIRGKINKIPDEDLIIPKLHTIGPMIEDAKFCIEEKEIREMFANLIAAAVDKEKSQKISPYFSTIIRNMTPLEALMLKNFSINKFLNDNNNYYLQIMTYSKSEINNAIDILLSKGLICFCNLYFDSSSLTTGSYYEIFNLFLKLQEVFKSIDKRDYDTHILAIENILTEIVLTLGENIYLTKRYIQKEFEAENEYFIHIKDVEVFLQKYQLTSIGKDFVFICL